MKAILLSGGMDSIALAYWLRPAFAFTMDYGQAAAAAEIDASVQIAHDLGIDHEVIRVDCSSLGSGDMAGSTALDVAPASEWWPFRNQLLVTLAGMRAVAMGVTEIMVGSVLSDGVHADGRPAFYGTLDLLMREQEGGLRVTAPAIGMSTVDLIRQSGIPRDLLAWAHSCHTGPLACGSCRGCVKHLETTLALGGVGY
ncbi:MAG: 7-cyano-7-deazaguanine synthase [Sphingomonas sp.]|uniref:7-cyano-7-deazaguanine synthase n=1 Tax=Sphingomonas aquatilis TaxID=93063 RepID=A0AAW3TXY7_9SPHN|nr:MULTISPECIES: 7-cyano-7-deazaguanine synthase [Sphingomonas]MBB3877015.1 7-cyano-7-deazaguanine synthase [Sphingomonas aquatilis]MCP4026412.1 7-cyano-7-deazaguanine synthase [Sphingomonas sp.]GEM71951.1 7-cyano-7-deazaguanine synthase [Sphingomonas aquatilis NBRC 16722]